jgi:phasin family protein
MRFAGVATGACSTCSSKRPRPCSLTASERQSAGFVKDLQQFAALKDNLAQPSIEKATAYAKSVYDVAAATQAEIGKLVEQQVADYNKQVVTVLDKLVKTAPAGSEVGIAALKSGIAAANSAYDNMSKVAKQFTEASQSNFDAVAKKAVNGAKKAKKAA